jgi:hypothetical protein
MQPKRFYFIYTLESSIKYTERPVLINQCIRFFSDNYKDRSGGPWPLIADVDPQKYEASALAVDRIHVNLSAGIIFLGMLLGGESQYADTVCGRMMSGG